jgi:hypothetical protein
MRCGYRCDSHFNPVLACIRRPALAEELLIQPLYRLRQAFASAQAETAQCHLWVEQLRFVDVSRSRCQARGSSAAVGFVSSKLATTAGTDFGSSGTTSNVTLGSVGRIS